MASSRGLNARSPAIAAAIGVFVFSLLLASIGAARQEQVNQAHAQEKFDVLSHQAAANVEQRVRSYEYGLRGARGTVVTSGESGLSREDFHRYGLSRDIDQEFPGALGFGIIWRVPQAEQDRFVAKARLDGWPDFQVRQLEAHAGERYVIQYIEPVDRNRAAVGLDIASELNRRTAAQTAMRTGKATLTAPITLVQATGKPTRSFLLLLPIYAAGQKHDTPEAREAATVGWSYAPLIIDDILRGLNSEQGHYTLSLRDKNGSDTVDFFSTGNSAAVPAASVKALVDMAIFGRTWEANIGATPAFIASLGQPSPQRVALLIAGVGAILAAFVGMWMLLRARTVSERIEAARRAAIVQATDDAIISTDYNGVITDWNPAAERLFGYSLDEAQGRQVTDLIVPADRTHEELSLLSAVQHGQRVPAFETIRRHQDGRLIDVAVTAVPILGRDGQCVGYAKTVRDMGHALLAKRALAQLNDSLERQVVERTSELQTALRDQQTIMDAVPSMIGYWNKDMTNRVANRAYQDWYGIDPHTLRGMSLHAMFGDTLFELNRPHIEAVLRGEPQVFERAIPRPDGTGVRHGLVNYLPDTDTDTGDIRGFYAIVHDVTELIDGRKQLAQAQRSSDGLLRAVNQHAIVSVADRHGRITEVNDAFCVISGYSREELIGQDHRILNSGHHPHAFWLTMWRTLSEGTAWRNDVCNRAKDGSLYWVSSIVSPFMDAEGNVEKYISIRTDITALKQTELALQHSNERFLLASASVEMGVWEYDLVSGLLTWDARMFTLYGRSASDGMAPYTLWSESLHPDDRAAIEADLQAAIDGTRRFDTTFRIVLQSGEIRHIKAAANVVRDETGRALCMTGVNFDVTAQVSAQEELTRTMSLLNSVLDAASESSIIATDPDGVITLFNRGAQHLLGYEESEVVGKLTPAPFHVPEEVAQRGLELSEEYKQPISGFQVFVHKPMLGHAETRRWTYVHKGGQRIPVSLTVTAIRNGSNDVVGFLGIAHDITTVESQAHQLREAVEKANQANAAKSRFLANMSHEIRTPMNAVIGLSYLLQRSKLTAKQKDMLGKIQGASKSLLDIINNVLDLSKIEAGEMRVEKAPFALSQVLDDVELLISVQAQSKGIELVIEKPVAPIPTLAGDALRLRQVLINLLSNAVKFTAHGQVKLVVSVQSATLPATRLRFDIVDTGIGMEADVLDSVFQPFVQADATTTRRFGGAGLGLSIVKQLVTLMQGDVGVASQPGTGTEFWVELPFELSPGQLSDPSRASPELHAQSLQGVQVLLADDNMVNLEVAQHILQLHGAVVSLAHNGQEVVDCLLAKSNAVDVVLMDVQMPVLDGLDATRRVRSALGLTALPIIGLTAGYAKSETQAARAAGMNDVLSKPFEPQDLVRCIRAHVAVQPASPTLSTPSRNNPPAALPFWPDIQGIATKQAANRFAGDSGVFKSMLRRTLNDYADLDAASNAPPDLVNLAFRMHGLKGQAATLGAQALAHQAAQLEAACRCGDVAQVPFALRSVISALAQLQRDAAAFLAATDAPAAKQPRPTQDPQAMAEFLQYLATADLCASKQFSKLSDALRQQLGEALFSQLDAYMGNLQFDLAHQLLIEHETQQSV